MKERLHRAVAAKQWKRVDVVVPAKSGDNRMGFRVAYGGEAESMRLLASVIFVCWWLELTARA